MRGIGLRKKMNSHSVLVVMVHAFQILLLFEFGDFSCARRDVTCSASAGGLKACEHKSASEVRVEEFQRKSHLFHGSASVSGLC